MEKICGNLLNIGHSADRWQGALEEQTDKSFYNSPPWPTATGQHGKCSNPTGTTPPFASAVHTRTHPAKECTVSHDLLAWDEYRDWAPGA